MKTLLSTLALLALTVSSYAQKFAIRHDVVTVDGQPYFRFESDGYNLLYLYSLQNERLCIVKQLLLNDPALSRPANPTGEQGYLQYVFLRPYTLVETSQPASLSGLPIVVARIFYAARLVQNGTVNESALADFALVNGTLYADRRQALNQAGWLPPMAPTVPVTLPPQNPHTPRP